MLKRARSPSKRAQRREFAPAPPSLRDGLSTTKPRETGLEDVGTDKAVRPRVGGHASTLLFTGKAWSFEFRALPKSAWVPGGSRRGRRLILIFLRIRECRPGRVRRGMSGPGSSGGFLRHELRRPKTRENAKRPPVCFRTPEPMPQTPEFTALGPTAGNAQHTHGIGHALARQIAVGH